MVILEFVFLMGLGTLLGLLGFKAVNEQKQQRKLDEAFYRLLETQNSQISLIQLAVMAQVDAEVARQYLDRQANVLSAMLEIDEEGDTFYRFPKLRLPPKLDRGEW